MQRRVVVVGIGDALVVGSRRGAEEVRFGAPAGGREVGRLGDFAAVGDDLVRVARTARSVRARLDRDPAVVLGAGVGVEREAVAADVGREGDRARRDGEGLQRRRRPLGRDLGRHRAAHVVVDVEVVDDVQRAGLRRGRDRLERAAVDADAGDPELAAAVGVQPRRRSGPAACPSSTAAAPRIRGDGRGRAGPGSSWRPQAALAWLKPTSPGLIVSSTRTSGARFRS